MADRGGEVCFSSEVFRCWSQCGGGPTAAWFLASDSRTVCEDQISDFSTEFLWVLDAYGARRRRLLLVLSMAKCCGRSSNLVVVRPIGVGGWRL